MTAENTEHYFSRTPKSKTQTRVVRATLRGQSFIFESDSGVFAKHGVDSGTRLLAEQVQVSPRDVVCDLGCGYGAIGVGVASECDRVVLIDINARAVQLAQRNIEKNGIRNASILQSDGMRAIRLGRIDTVACNPPIRAGNSVVFRMIDEAAQAMKPGGSLWIVVQTKQGARSLQRKMEALFTSVEVVAIKGGYRVIRGAN